MVGNTHPVSSGTSGGSKSGSEPTYSTLLVSFTGYHMEHMYIACIGTHEDRMMHYIPDYCLKELMSGDFGKAKGKSSRDVKTFRSRSENARMFPAS
jgi:hypothetical protein